MEITPSVHVRIVDAFAFVQINGHLAIGAYAIDTTHSELDVGKVRNIYTTLTKVEDCFRSLKSDL